jgi:hypothetical protein
MARFSRPLLAYPLAWVEEPGHSRANGSNSPTASSSNHRLRRFIRSSPIGWYIPYVFLCRVLRHNSQPRVVGCARDHDRPQRRCANDNISAGVGDHDKNQYARGPRDNAQADITPFLAGCCVLLTAAAIVAGTNSYQKYGFVPGDRISMLPPSCHATTAVPCRHRCQSAAVAAKLPPPSCRHRHHAATTTATTTAVATTKLPQLPLCCCHHRHHCRRHHAAATTATAAAAAKLPLPLPCSRQPPPSCRHHRHRCRRRHEFVLFVN